MGCPDWPLCDGRLGPVFQYHALMEQTHRYLAALATFLVVGTALLAWRRATSRAALRAALFTVAVVVVQIALGAVTVFAGNGAPTVAAHLIAGLALLGGATVTAVATKVPQSESSGRRLDPIGWVAISFAGLLYVSGSLVVNAEAEKACASFPLCPSNQPAGFVALHLVHRGFAALAGLALLAFALHAWQDWSNRKGARGLAVTLGLLVVFTATLGIFSALLKAPPGLQDFHLAGAAAVLATSVALATLGWLTGADSPRPSHELPHVADESNVNEIGR
jgi:cytochrome c oxidase assembly protein subunit 15